MYHLLKFEFTPPTDYTTPRKLDFTENISILNTNTSVTCSGLTSPHSDAADVLLSQEVPDLHQSSSLLNDDVDGEMGVHRAHLVPETLQSDRRARERR